MLRKTASRVATAIPGPSLSLGLLLILVMLTPVRSESAEAGFRDFEYGPTVEGSPTGEKAESKLWHADGQWWGCLWSPVSAQFEIHRLDVATQSWVATGTAIDSRPNTRCDALWEAPFLYIVSHTRLGDAGPALLSRYTYDSVSDDYTLDANFPVEIATGKSETLTIERDSSGQLWASWEEDGKIKINRSTVNDWTWGTPFDIPVQGSDVTNDDICSIVAFGGNRIGVMWSDQALDGMYFAVHLDSSPDLIWEPVETALTDAGLGLGYADDHINLAATCDSTGEVYAVTKTTFVADTDPQIFFLKRDGAGSWSSTVAATQEFEHTRPIVVIDDSTRTAYLFATSTDTGDNCIFMKSTSLDSPSFADGLGTPVLCSAEDLALNNVTATKQCVHGSTDLVILAADSGTRRYIHHYLDLGAGTLVVSAFSPAAAAEGQQIDILGTGLSSVTSVELHGTSLGFTTVSDSRLTLTVPAGVTTGPLHLTGPTGTVVSAQKLTVIQTPVISSFTPASGPVMTEVTITGSDFDFATTVAFGGSLADSFVVDSATQIRARVPVFANPGALSVTNPAGTGFSAGDFVVVHTPVVATFTPQSGPAGAEITITGIDFASVSEVTFGGVPAASFTLDSATQLRAVVPGDASTGKIGLTNGAGTGFTFSDFVFFRPPVIGALTPTAALEGAEVTITGSGFTGTSQVSFGDSLTAGFTVDADSVLRTDVPPGAVTAAVRITNPAGTDTSATDFVVIRAPAIASFSPSDGPVGTEVTLSGSGFDATTEVAFGGVPASIFTVDADSTMRATVPAGGVAGPIRMTNAAGSDTTASPFVVIHPPQVAALAPAAGLVGAEITLSGSGFVGVTEVAFGDSLATFTVDADSVIRTTVPAGAETAPVRVTNSAGADTTDTDFVVVYAPAITSFSPASGPEGGTVTLSGTGFLGTGEVAFGDSVASFTVESDSVLLATVPTGAPSGPIRVTNAAASDTSATDFTVIHAPVISSLTPGSGAAGDEITIAGSGFVGTIEVTFPDSVSAAFTVDSDSIIRTTVPSGAVSGALQVTNAAGTTASALGLLVLHPPVVTTVTPSSGPVGTELTISGGSFTGTTAVTFSDSVASLFTVDSDSVIRATVPPGATAGPIRLTNGDGTGETPDGFVVIHPPAVVSFSPASAPVGNDVTLVGTGFTGTTEVAFGDSVAVFTVHSDSSLAATIPSGAITAPIRVGNAGGADTTASAFVVIRPPVISSFTPSGDIEGAEISLLGAGFTGTTDVAFGATAAVFTVDADSSLRATVPPGAATGPIHVTNAAGSVASSTDFVVIVPPSVSSFTPGTGPAGAEIALQGSGLTGTTEVAFGEVAALGFTVDSDSSLRAIVPGGAVTAPLRVTNLAGSDTTAAAFVVIQPPAITLFTPTSGETGSEVTVTGSGFTGLDEVLFGDSTATFTVDADSVLRATVPPGARTGTLRVTNAAGADTSLAPFTVLLPPVVTSFTPAHGLPGIEISFTGSDLTAVTDVFFSDSLAAAFTVDTDSSLRATVPAGAVTGTVRLVNTDGAGETATDFIVVQAPSLSGFSPASGAAGAEITLSGSGFGGTTAVMLSDSVAAIFFVDSDSVIRANVPADAVTGAIRVENAAGADTSDTAFTILYPPVLTSFSPGSGPAGVEVTLTGSGFTGATAVAFADSIAAFTVDSDSLIRANVPAGASTGTIRVTNADGFSENADPFVVVLPPAVAGFAPASGPAGTEITLTGTGFTGTTDVSLGGISATFTTDSDSIVRFAAPAGASTGPIRIANAADADTTTIDFVVIETPEILTFSPASALAGTEVTLTGLHFLGTTEVAFGAFLTGFTVDSDSVIRATAPAGAKKAPIRVTNAAGSHVSASDFQVIEPPVITSFTPDSGPVGAEVTLEGVGFLGVHEVAFGDSVAAFTVQSDALLRANVPAGAETGSIRIANAAGADTSIGEFVVIDPPVIASFTPATGTTGTEVSITGSGFIGTTELTFGGTPALFTVDADASVRATVPPGASSGALTIVNAAAADTSATAFTVLYPPVLTSFAPAQGPVGTIVTLTGASFTGTTSVEFGGGVSAVYAVDSDTSIRAAVPAGAAPGLIRITNADGSVESATDFAAIRVPAISAMSPASGLPGVEVSIAGSGFTTTSEVEFGGSTIASFAVDSDSTLRATVPAGAVTGPIRITNPAGTGSSQPFSVIVPSGIASLSPASGIVGEEMTITGSGFTGATEVAFFDSVATTFTVESDSLIRTTVPPGAITGPVRVENPAGTSVSPSDFVVYRTPSIASFSPPVGPVGTSISFAGSGFSGITAVTFANSVSAGFTVESDTSLTVTVPAGAVTGSIRVANVAGDDVTPSDFLVIQSPTVSSFAPLDGIAGTEVSIAGTGFTGTTVVTFGGSVAAGLTVDSDSLVRATVPGGAFTGAIEVVNSAGTGSSAIDFTVYHTPAIAAFSPVAAPVGVEITITGSHFVGTSVVTFGDTDALTFTVDDDSSVRATVPAGASTGALRLTNAAGTGISAASFVVAVPPSIASFSPALGVVGTEVSILGAGFLGTTSVAFGDSLALVFTVDSDSLIRAEVPAGAVTSAIRVTNPAGAETSLTTFSVVLAPTVASFTPASGVVGAEVTFHGSGFTGVSAVQFSDSTLAPFTVDSDSLLRAQVPAGAGTGPIHLTNADGTGVTASDFAVIVTPAVSSLAPGSGPEGIVVALGGSGFTGTVLVTFADSVAAPFTVLADTLLLTTVPAGAPNGSIRVSNAAGTADAPVDFVVIRPPAITSFDPPAGTPGSLVTLSGSGFTGVSSVVFADSAAALFAVQSDSVIQAAVPVGAQTGRITITNVAASTESALDFQVGIAPVVISFEPDFGPPGTEVTILGIGLSATTTVAFGTIVADSFVVDSDFNLRVFVPDFDGVAPIVVTSPSGSSTSSTEFTLYRSTSSGPLGGLPADFGLQQNRPNPFRSRTEIHFQLPRSSRVHLVIHNVLGQEVLTLVDEELPAGFHSIPWQGRDSRGTRVASGVYFYSLRTPEFVDRRKMLRLK